MTSVLAAVWVHGAAAQPWTSDQQELLDLVAQCNDGWAESHREDDFRIFVEACPELPGAMAWYTGSPARVQYSANDEFWSGANRSGAEFSWEFQEPIDIFVDRDVAAVYFPVVWTIEAPDGTTVRVPSRRMSTLVRRNGRWLFAASSIAGFEENSASLLVDAALEGNRDAVAFLLDHGRDVNERAANGYTALHAAAYAGHLDIVELLVERRAAIDDQQNGEAIAALHAAAETNRPAIVAYLLAQGAAVDPVQAGGWTPIMRATFKGHAEIVKLLRSYGGQCLDRASADAFNYCMNAGS
jgi:hypothetical protein